MADFNYGVLLRFGINQFILFFEYRISNRLNPIFVDQFPNVPQITAGIQIGLHR